MKQNTKSRLLIVTPALPPEIGGPATYAHFLLEKLPEEGFEVRAVSYGKTAGHSKAVRYILFSWRILKESFWADAIYAMDPVFGLAGWCAARLTGKKYYLKIVGDYAWEQGTNRFGVTDMLDTFVMMPSSSYRLPVRFLRSVQTFVARHADSIITPSQYLKTIVIKWGIDPQKISVIYNAFTAPALIRSQEEVRQSLGLSGTIIVSAGRLVPWKGFKTLIRVIKKFRQSRPEIRLLIAGDGPDATQLKNYITQEQAESYVILLGRIAHEHVLAYCRAADVFVLNTGYEGLSHQLLEVMAMGTPIITTRVGGNPELITDGVTGSLVAYNDEQALSLALSDILSHYDKAKERAEAAEEKVKEFNSKTLLLETAAILKKYL